MLGDYCEDLECKYGEWTLKTGGEIISEVFGEADDLVLKNKK